MNEALDNRVALITGANRGIGRAIANLFAAEGAQVLLACRDLEAGKAAAEEIGNRSRAELVDLKSAKSIEALGRRISQDPGRLDILVNNAGVLLDMDDRPSRIDGQKAMETYRVNVVGAALLTDAVLPLLHRSDFPRVLNVSSGWGSLEAIGGSGEEMVAPSYRLSKAALNAFTVMLAEELRDSDILVNALCPGWVRTEMGGPDADRSPEDAARGALAMALFPDDGPTGRFFRDAEEIHF